MNYSQLCNLADKLEAQEITNQRKTGCETEVIKRVDLHCDECDDHQRANCADTLRTFGAMHIHCDGVEAHVIG